MKGIKNSSQGFTLLELLVVVLIIGILVGIALPKYRLAVLKSQFNSIKTISASIWSAQQRYVLQHDVYPVSLSDLDIDLPETLPYDGNCYIGGTNNYHRRLFVGCKIKNGKLNYFTQIFDGVISRTCVAYSLDKTDIYNKLCQQETNDNDPSQTSSTAYSYKYQ